MWIFTYEFIFYRINIDPPNIEVLHYLKIEKLILTAKE